LKAAFVQQNPPRAYNQQWNLTVQRQLTTNTILTLGYVGSHGVHIPLGVDDIDLVPPQYLKTAPDGHLAIPAGSPRINPAWGRIPATFWNDVSHYNGMIVDFDKRLSGGSWSKSIDFGSTTFSSTETYNGSENPYPFITSLNRGPSDYDVRHNGVIHFTWNIPGASNVQRVSKDILAGWQLGGIFSARTGPPFGVSLTADTVGTGNKRQRMNAAQRPDFNPLPGCSTKTINPGNLTNYIKTQCFSVPKAGEIGNLGRNTLRAPGFQTFDPSLSKT
jgi:hypothetical protein